MLIATPKLIDQYIKGIKSGRRINIKSLRRDLAITHHADYTCPVTTGIFLRIVAEANYEKWQQGISLNKITPFWRVIEPDSALAKKLTFGQEFLVQQIRREMTEKEPSPLKPVSRKGTDVPPGRSRTDRNRSIE